MEDNRLPILLSGRKFELLSDSEIPSVAARVVLSDCTLFACHLGTTAKCVEQRRRIINVEIRNCKATNNSSLGPVILEDVDVDGLLTGGVCMTWGAAFRHVKLRGNCGRIVLNLPQPGTLEADFVHANNAFYSATDWALDISGGEFEELEVRGVPAELVKRDPETQVVCRLSRVTETEDAWRNLNLSDTPWVLALENMLRWKLASQVLVAPKRNRRFARWLDGLQLLRRAGVAEDN